MKELKKSDPNSKVLAVTYVCVALFLALAVLHGIFSSGEKRGCDQ